MRLKFHIRIFAYHFYFDKKLSVFYNRFHSTLKKGIFDIYIFKLWI